MDDLARWLGQQLDEDARTAREALRYVAADWVRDEAENVVRAAGLTAAGEEAVAITAARWQHPMIETPGVTGHIAEHDPARVLREIDAKRQILRALESAEVALRNTEPGKEPHELMTGAANSLRAAARMLATAYADRPGYRESWRP
jgi:hypothetical protein